ncbi:MAG TPA: chitinase [Clostridiales bacterium]|nr:MAG: chitinase [Clostridiales bacterium GWD2_32_59]HAN10020.1 chitinase [Clostridiales bacterium]
MKCLKRYFAVFLAFVMFVTCFVGVTEAGKGTTKNILTAPTNLIAGSITKDEIDLQWDSVVNATGYRVYGATSSDISYKLLGTVYAMNYNHTNLQSSTVYSYYIVAFNKFTVSSESVHVNFTTEALPVITPPVSTEKVVLGYATYYYSGDKSSYNSMVANKDAIDEIVTHTYTVDGSGNLTGIIPLEQIQYAKSNNIKVQASISNQFSGLVAKQLLESATNRATLINNILVEIGKYGYAGVNVDIEGVYAINREHMTTFMKELYETLNPKGYLVTIAVPAKTYDSTTDGWNGAFDYKSLNMYADQIVIMTYDEHYPGGTLGAIASYGWVKRVVEYAVTVIPKEKILLGVAAYGYDWSSSGTKSYSVSKAYEIATTYGATIIWDSVSQTPHYTYIDTLGVSHEVWFENSYSIPFKLNMVNDYGLLGVAIWRLGLEDAAYMSKISSMSN